jgi:hypothetical protein
LLKVDNDANVDPPIHAAYYLFSDAKILIFLMPMGAIASISFLSLSENP